jgi:hypothetical protein
MKIKLWLCSMISFAAVLVTMLGISHLKPDLRYVSVSHNFSTFWVHSVTR